MWRAFVMAVGLSLCILGGECMIVDRVVVARDGSSGSSYTTTDELSAWASGAAPSTKRRVLIPPEWAPWGLLSAGALAANILSVIMLLVETVMFRR